MNAWRNSHGSPKVLIIRELTPQGHSEPYILLNQKTIPGLSQVATPLLCQDSSSRRKAASTTSVTPGWNHLTMLSEANVVFLFG